jgi:hypothetical protein
MRYFLFIIALSLISCNKQVTTAAPRGTIGVTIDWINFLPTDHPVNNASFSIFLDAVQQQVTFSNQHSESQTIAQFTATSGQTIHFNLNPEKASQLGYIFTIRAICDNDTSIIYLSDTTDFTIP